MLHLAQVQKSKLSEQVELSLLAHQQTIYKWEMEEQGKVISVTEEFALPEGVLVLIDLSPKEEILSIQDATAWVLYLVKTYLTNSVTPAFLKAEADRAEQWGQSLTLQNQDLSQRSSEVEARRKQIQALEESFKRDTEVLRGKLRKALSKVEAEIQSLSNRLNNPKFVDKAPEEVVKTIRDNLLEAKKQAQILRDRLQNLE